MTYAIIFVLAVAAIAFFFWVSRNATLLFEAQVQRGRIVKFSGRAPKRLVRDFNDVLSFRPVPNARIRVCSSSGKAELIVKGDITDSESQRLRNVLGTFPLAQIRSEPFRKQ
ncbi:MAG: DUF3634 family protein [Polyangiaceae bacterium]|nr:DUF3634 family protein [Polyangiaceae bacterium]